MNYPVTIKALREKPLVTQTELAEMLGCTFASVSRWERALIKNFLAGIADAGDVMEEWHAFIAAEKERALLQIITEERLKEPETRDYIRTCFQNGYLKTNGVDLDRIMPPISRFGNSGRAATKQRIVIKLTAFFEQFYGIGE